MISVNRPKPHITTEIPQLRFELNGRFPAPLASQLYQRGSKSANPELLAQYINTWIRTFGPMDHHVDGDFEHFVENMARVDAATRSFGYENTTVELNPTPNMSALYNFADGCPVLPDEATLPDFVFGPVVSCSNGHPGPHDRGPAGCYWNIPAFKELSGRRWMLAGLRPDDQNEPDLLGVLQSMFDDGIRRFVVKGTVPKSLLEQFTLTVRPTSLYGRDCEIPAEVLDATMHLEGESDVFLVQEHIPMTHEYRFFMAGAQPAAGAGCIEHFTPLDHDFDGSDFDPRTESVRGSGDVSSTPVLVERMRQFATQAGSVVHAQASDLGAAWVMDLAINADTDEVIVIELNPARNAGLYAASPGAWMSEVRNYLAS